MEMSNHMVDIMYCHTEDQAQEMFNYYIQKGHKVALSTILIRTGTHGDCVVKKLEVFK